MKKVRLRVYDKKNGKEFIKEFETEFERDKYIRRSKYFKNLIIIGNHIEEDLLK